MKFNPFLNVIGNMFKRKKVGYMPDRYDRQHTYVDNRYSKAKFCHSLKITTFLVYKDILPKKNHYKIIKELTKALNLIAFERGFGHI